MIGKQIKGRGFRGLLNYLAEKPNACLIGGNMSGRNSRELAAEFGISRQLNRNADRAVYHVSLSLKTGERLDDDTWNEISDRYLTEMGFDSNQYAVYRHFDTNHDHIHIAASRIRLDTGNIVHDGWDYLRSEKIIRQIEKDYGLQPTTSSREKKTRTASTGQQRRVKRELVDYEKGDRELPPSPPIKQQLQEVILSLTRNRPSMPELIAKLHQAEVEVRCEFTRTGKSKGISYCKDGISFSGTNLGAAFTWTGLQKHLGIKGFLEQDKLQIQMLFERIASQKPIDDNYIERIRTRRGSYSDSDSNSDFITDTQYDYAAQLATAVKNYWRQLGEQSKISGKNYKLEITSDGGELTLIGITNNKKIALSIPLDSSLEATATGLNSELVQQLLVNLSHAMNQSDNQVKHSGFNLKNPLNSQSKGFER